MKIFGRQDLLAVVGLAAAVLILFSPPLSRVFTYARQVEAQSGLSLIPALAILAAVLVFYQVRRRTRISADLMAEAARRDEHARWARDVGQLSAFGQALSRATDVASIRVSIAQHLPALAGTSQVWALVREGAQWEALAGDTRGSDEAFRWGDLAEQLLAGQEGQGEHHRAIGFPLMAGSTAIGVLGIRPEDGTLPDDRRRAIEAATTSLALAIRHAQLLREVRENSVRDALTGCFTRTHALEVVDAELRRARRSHSPVSMILLDVDRLKEVNDRYGHLGGDAVLADIARRMHGVLRGSDLKARYDGEQFLVLLPETPLPGAKRVAETLRREVADRPVPWSGEHLLITASFGIAQALTGEVTVPMLVARAAEALARAQQDGGNCVRLGADPASVTSDASPDASPEPAG